MNYKSETRTGILFFVVRWGKLQFAPTFFHADFADFCRKFLG